MTTSNFDFKDAFIAAIKANQRVFSHDRRQTVGASEVFACIRRAWFAKFKPELAEEMDMGAAERGNVVENMYVVGKLGQIFGKENVLYMGDEQNTFVSGRNSATPDALVFTPRPDILARYGVPDIGGNCFGIEIKSFDPRLNLAEEKIVHRGQGITQLGLIRELTKYKPNFVVILYINAADFYDIRPFVVEFDEGVYAMAKQRANLVFDTKDAYDLRAEGVHVGACRYCPFEGACKDAELSKYPSAKKALKSDNEKAILAGYIEKHQEAHRAIAEHETVKSEYTEHIKRFLNACGVTKAEIPGFGVSYSKMDGRESLDTAAMEADGINLDDYQKKGKGYTRLQVTPKKV